MRKQVIAQLLSMDPDDRSHQEAALLDRFPHLPGFAHSHVVLLYASHFPEEINTRPLVDLAISLGKTVVFPRVDRVTKRLVPHLATETFPGTLGIPEPLATHPIVDPRAIDWALVPGVAFDRHGFRLGRGGGFYDKLLPTLRPNCPRWALILEPQWVDSVPVEAHDARLDGVASATVMVEVDRDIEIQ